MAIKSRNTSACAGQGHPLLGKVIRIDSDDGASHGVSRIVADLDNGLMLAKRLMPRTGRDIEVWHIIVLAVVGLNDMTEIYDSWEAYRRAEEGPPDEDRVVRLVPKPPA